MKKKVLHIVGSLNQTKQLHKISLEMPEYDHYFTQYFGEGIFFKWIAESGLVDWTIMGTNSAFRKEQKSYLQKVQAKYDYRGERYRDEYELVFMCSDLMVPTKFYNAKLVFVQEGMTDPVSNKSMLVRKLRLPGWMTGDTSLNGCSNQCDLYCVASEGYAKFFTEMGTDEYKIRVTGIPNFDHAASFINNDFPLRNYVLVCTSDIREVGGKEDRMEFLQSCKNIAGGRKIVFKLHPNEKVHRAIREIEKVFADTAEVYTACNTDHMIANCEELITQFSSVVYIGMALGKKVYSYFPIEQLKERMPIQNGGTSAKLIAEWSKAILLEEDLEFVPAVKYFQSSQLLFND